MSPPIQYRHQTPLPFELRDAYCSPLNCVLWKIAFGADTSLYLHQPNFGFIGGFYCCFHLTLTYVLFITYHQGCNQSNTPGLTSEKGTVYSSGALDFTLYIILVGFVLLNLYFSVQCLIDSCLSFFFRPFCCVSFDLRMLITPLVSSNSSLYNITDNSCRQNM